jgi:hypothetical protein
MMDSLDLLTSGSKSQWAAQLASAMHKRKDLIKNIDPPTHFLLPEENETSVDVDHKK